MDIFGVGLGGFCEGIRLCGADFGGKLRAVGRLQARSRSLSFISGYKYGKTPVYKNRLQALELEHAGRVANKKNNNKRMGRLKFKVAWSKF
ncbi:hypothetical protein J5N97_024524 [Dioscorea zingiberensis]|uniref:Uncharacterized protein n=1 Tax=Dioscorea zingiberensis TaxID=325984 RepID=A0A9D5H8Z6_9LILI|nr:hypothetical protein J5N97_024524 [Dioscorea zingiberensis]